MSPRKRNNMRFKSKFTLHGSTTFVNQQNIDFALTEGPIGLDAPIHELVGRTVLNSKQISEWPLCPKILMTPLTN
nr:hypothetical protein CFP56_59196 [Quercus suber]